MQLNTLQLALGALALTALVSALSFRTTMAPVEMESSAIFPGAGKAVAGWIEEWEHLSNVDNVNSINTHGMKSQMAANLQRSSAHKMHTVESHPHAPAAAPDREASQHGRVSLSVKTAPKEVGAQWKSWATAKAKSLHERTHRIAEGPGGWSVYLDAKTERPFYYNEETGVSSWKSPWSETKNVAHVMPKAPVREVRRAPLVYKGKAVGGEFGVKSQQDDMNNYFDALQSRIDRKIVYRENAEIKKFGEDRWKPEHKLEKRESSWIKLPPVQMPARVHPVHVKEVREKQWLKEPPVKMPPPPVFAHAPQPKPVQEKPWLKLPPVEDPKLPPVQDPVVAVHPKAVTPSVGAKPAAPKLKPASVGSILAKAWDSMEGGEGSEMEAKEHF